MASCATKRSYNNVEEEEKRDQDNREVVVPYAQSLADYLVQIPGVFVDDRTYPPTVTVRGGRPLFVVDGVPVGNSYASAANIVNPIDIRSVEVLKNPAETIIYGRRAAHGVILIRTMPPRDVE